MDRDGGPVLAEHLLTEGFPLHELDGFKPADDPLSGIRKAADTGEQVQKAQWLGHGWWCCPSLAAVWQRLQRLILVRRL